MIGCNPSAALCNIPQVVHYRFYLAEDVEGAVRTDACQIIARAAG